MWGSAPQRGEYFAVGTVDNFLMGSAPQRGEYYYSFKPVPFTLVQPRNAGSILLDQEFL
jgi:hypothetical protein